MVSAVASFLMPDGSICWDSARGHLARRTASLIAEDTAPSGLSGGEIAEALGIDLPAFAAECWASLNATTAQAAAEAAGLAATIGDAS